MESSHEMLMAASNNDGADDVTETNVEPQSSSPPITNRIACKTGHVLNELTASVWFSYALLFFQNVAALSPVSSGVLFSLSQLFVAVGMVVVGFSYDKRLWKSFLLYGRRKARHIVGSAGVLLSWPLVFVPCLICKPSISNLGVTAYYLLPVVLFSVCWSLAEASYSSLMLEIQARTNKVSESARSSIVRVCNVSLYILLWVLLQHSPKENLNSSNGSKEFARFVVIFLPVGFVFVFAFHLTVLEPTTGPTSPQGKQTEEKYSGRSLTSISVANKTSRCCLSWCDWLTEPLVYQVGIVCVFTNIAIRLLQVYLPLYLIETLRLRKESIAFFPLVMVISRIVTEISLQSSLARINPRVTVLCTTVTIFGTCMWLFLQTISKSPLVYVPTLIFACMSSLLTIVTTKLQQKLTGNDMEAAHFVSTVFESLERLFLGGMVLVVQMFYPDKKDRSIGDYIRVAFPAACGTSILIPLLVTTAFMNSEQGTQLAITLSSAIDDNSEMQANLPISHCIDLPGFSTASTPPVDIELSQRRCNSECVELEGSLLPSTVLRSDVDTYEMQTHNRRDRDIEDVKRALEELHRLSSTDL